MKLRPVLTIIFLTVIVFGASAQKEIFIKQVEFKLDRISDIDYENEYFMTIKLNKGSKYIFRVTNHIDSYVGEAVIELLDADNLILTNVYTEKYYTNINFICNKTGFYDLLIKFRDNKLGNSVIDILMVQ
ncbi:MAG: hypothetical protein JW894_08240 [Bacteroidales bacterium]|nr:hypothetical protein [Bacteroidales bacterium]